MSAAAAAREAASEAEEKRLRQRISSEDKRLNTLKAGRLQYAEQTRQFLVDGVQSQFELIKQDAEDEFAREKSALQDRLVQVKAVSRDSDSEHLSLSLINTFIVSVRSRHTRQAYREDVGGREGERESHPCSPRMEHTGFSLPPPALF